MIAAGVSDDLVAGLFLGFVLGFLGRPIVGSWMSWRESIRASREADLLDNVVARMDEVRSKPAAADHLHRPAQHDEAVERGAGELLVTSIDRDGTKAGFDCEMTAAVSNAVSIPVIASGGAGGLDDFLDVFTKGAADAALAASIFHYAETSVASLKNYLSRHGVPVREPM